MSLRDIKAVFDPIEHSSVVDGVVDQIETMIVSGVLKEGRKLPPEREMAEVLQVSRPKLREALKRLETEGLIVVRHGGGTFVGPLVGKALSPALTELYARHSARAFFDYLEYRREQEGFAAGLAAQRATDIDFEIITDILTEMDRAHEADDRKAARKADIDFHTAVVDSSHNTTLIHMMASIYDLTRKTIFYNRDYLHTLEDSAEMLLQQHHNIAQAIFNRDAKAARKAAQDHIDYVRRSIRKGQEVSKRNKVSSKMQVASKTKSSK
jgi:GntR family transcriptional regulator, transcriptional repressor for pyruvate dehydrogenase complex